MLNFNWKDLAPGYVQGICRVCVSYPFDYIRLNLQTRKDKTILSSLSRNRANLYRGILFPIISVPVDRAISFCVYEKLKEKTESPLLSSIFPSVLSNLYMTPINLVNSQFIYHNKSSIADVIGQNTYSSLYSGFRVEVVRNTLSSFFFLYSYSYFSLLTESPFINGSLASAAMWTVMYPLDTIKANKFVFQKSYMSILKENSLRSLYRGVLLVYLRAFPSAGIGMTAYETTKEILVSG